MKIPAIILGLALFSLSACNRPKSDFSNPEAQVVRGLSGRRIVMLGDFAHEFPLVQHTLISTLSNWLSMLEKGETDQNRLTLFLEEDNHIAILLRQYLKNGDLNPLLDFILPSTSIERFEFYVDLRRITTRIDSMNGLLPSSKKIVFDLQGPEEMNIFDPKMLDLSARDGVLFYAKERDSLAAGHIINYFREHPNQKGLVFYSNGHLIKNIIEKMEFTSQLTPTERTGAYLGYFLKREYGDDQVFTVNQVGLDRSRLKLPEADGVDRIILSSDVPWKDSNPDDEDLLPKNFDAFMVRHEYSVRSHPFRCVFSKRIIESSLKRLESLEPHQSGAMGNKFYQQALRTLSFLCDTNFLTAMQWKSWCSAHPFGGLEHLQSDVVRRRLADDCFRALGTPKFSGYIDGLIDMGFDPRIGSPTMTRQEWDRDFDQMWPQMVFLNAIGVFFVGSPDEVADAKNYLIKKSGQNFDEPDMYLKWWRKNFYDVTY